MEARVEELNSSQKKSEELKNALTAKSADADTCKKNLENAVTKNAADLKTLEEENKSFLAKNQELQNQVLQFTNKTMVLEERIEALELFKNKEKTECPLCPTVAAPPQIECPKCPDCPTAPPVAVEIPTLEQQKKKAQAILNENYSKGSPHLMT